MVQIDPHKVWDFYKSNRGSLAFDTREILTDNTGNISVHITDEDDELEIYVMVNGIVSYTRSAQDEESCVDVMEDIIDRFFPEEDDDLSQDDPVFVSDYLAAFAEKNEETLDSLLYEFLEAVIEDMHDVDDVDQLCSEVKDLVCEHLAYNLGIEVHRPMVLEDETGKEFYTDTPYEYLEQ